MTYPLKTLLLYQACPLILAHATQSLNVAVDISCIQSQTQLLAYGCFLCSNAHSHTFLKDPLPQNPFIPSKFIHLSFHFTLIHMHGLSTCWVLVSSSDGDELLTTFAPLSLPLSPHSSFPLSNPLAHIQGEQLLLQQLLKCHAVRNKYLS